MEDATSSDQRQGPRGIPHRRIQRRGVGSFFVYPLKFVFVLLYWNVYRKRVALALTPAQTFDAWAGIRSHLVSVFVGVLSVVLALTVPIEWIWLAGVIYMLQAPLHWRNGMADRTRARAFPAATD